MIIGHDREQDGEQFPGDGDGDEGQGSIVFQGIKDEALTQGATEREHDNVLDDGWVSLTKSDGIAQFRSEGVEE